MAQSSIFYLPELLEQILHFLAIDKSLYHVLFVGQLWYRCSTPILWRCIELKENEVEDKFWLKRFLKIVPEEEKKLVYSSKLIHFKITYYPSFSNKKIKDIVYTFQNIIHLDFKGSINSIGKVLKLTVIGNIT